MRCNCGSCARCRHREYMRRWRDRSEPQGYSARDIAITGPQIAMTDWDAILAMPAMPTYFECLDVKRGCARVIGRYDWGRTTCSDDIC